MKKKIIFIVILIAFLALVYANGNAKNVPMSEISKALISKTDISKMEKCKNKDLTQFIGINYKNYDSYIYYKGKEALSVEELLIVKANNKEDLNSVRDAVESRIDSQISTFEGYGPKQVSQLNNNIIKVKGQYLFYCVSDTPEVYEGVFKDVI
ncbi:MAG: DUF4358 domain-containing protein [Eubacteriales bacterium]|nr:DUF4358 domain-containing protein [Eubacteriales bacterium]